MEFTGSIRGSINGADIALKNYDNGYEKLTKGPLFTTIEQLYTFIISNKEAIHLNDRFFRVEINNTSKGSRRSVTVPTAFGSIKVYRYTPKNSFVPNDRAGFSINIETEISSETN